MKLKQVILNDKIINELETKRCQSCGKEVEVNQEVIIDENKVTYCEYCHINKKENEFEKKMVSVEFAGEMTDAISFVKDAYLNYDVKLVIDNGDSFIFEVNAPKYIFNTVHEENIKVYDMNANFLS